MDDPKKGALKDLGQRINKLLPDEKFIGQPFWALMETKNGNITGSYFVNPGKKGEKSLPLFLSKYHAEFYLSNQDSSLKGNYVVRGLSQEQLRFLSSIAEEDKIIFMMFCFHNKGTEWVIRTMDGKALKAEFFFE